MGYRDWVINGIRPKYITSDGIDWSNFPQVTLHCAATPDKYYADAREEIAKFSEFAAKEISNTTLINGGTKVQCSRDGRIVTIREGDKVWQGAIHYPKFKEDKFSDEIIEWDLILELEVEGTRPPYRIYSPPYSRYFNIIYHPWITSEGGGGGEEDYGGTIIAYPNSVEDYDNSGDWSNLENIKYDDGQLASAYNDDSAAKAFGSIKCTDWRNLETGNYVNLPENARITQYGFHVKFATDRDSIEKIPGRNIIASAYSAIGDKMQIPYTTRYPGYLDLQGNLISNPCPNTPANMAWLAWDTEIPNTIGLDIEALYPKVPSVDRDCFNDPNIEFKFAFGAEPYKHFWIDAVQFKIVYILDNIAQNETVYDPGFYGYEIGYMMIQENKPVKQVEIVGSACNIPSEGAWVEVNGIRQYWHYSHDHNTGDTGENGVEMLTFQLQEPTTTIEIKTSRHDPPTSDTTAETNSGCKLYYVKVVYL